jgi:hypothetical protein
MKTKKDQNKKDDDKTQREGRGGEREREKESTETTRTAKQTDRQQTDRHDSFFVATAKRDAERERGSKLLDFFFFASSSLNQNQNNCATPGKEKTGGGKKKAETERGNERQEGDNLTSNKTKGNDPPEKRARTQTGRA